MVHHGPKDTNSELSCLTAMTFDGKILWRIGEPDGWKDSLTNDVGFQVHDLDGDGRTEVVYCMNMKLIVADGATGKTKYEAPTPSMPQRTKPPYDKFPRILGDSLFFCDLRGTGHARDIIIKTRYDHLWAFNDRWRSCGMRPATRAIIPLPATSTATARMSSPSAIRSSTTTGRGCGPWTARCRTTPMAWPSSGSRLARSCVCSVPPATRASSSPT